MGPGKLHGEGLAMHEVPAQSRNLPCPRKPLEQLQIPGATRPDGVLPAGEAGQIEGETVFTLQVTDSKTVIVTVRRVVHPGVGGIDRRYNLPIGLRVGGEQPIRPQMNVVETGRCRLCESDRGELIIGQQKPDSRLGKLVGVQRDTALKAQMMARIRVGIQQVERFQSLGSNLRSNASGYGRPQPPAMHDVRPGFDQDAREVLGQYPAEILPFLYGRSRDAGLQILSVMMVMVPYAAGLVETTEPDHRVIGQFPAYLQALQVALMV